MTYYIHDMPIQIDQTKKPFGQGSEGKIYRKKDQLYKIYNKEAIYELGYDKLYCHQYLIGIPTKQINLPNALIFNEHGDYIGYRMDLIPGKQNLFLRTGMSQMPSQKLIANLEILENDLIMLAKYQVTANDVQPANYIYNNENQTMHIIDPGRYSVIMNIENDVEKATITKTCQADNLKQYDSLITQLIYNDLIAYKPIKNKEKLQQLRDYIQWLKSTESYSNFFKKELENFATPHAYFKSLERHLH